MKQTTTPDISVIIPTLNAEKYLPALIPCLLKQTIKPREILIIDSSSTDSTHTLINEFIKNGGPIRLIVIKKEDFGHGKTRNAAAEQSCGDILVFITQDALPVDDHWLQHLTKPFLANLNVGGVFGRHIAQPDCNPIIIKDIQKHFSAYGRAPYLFQQINWQKEDEQEEYKKKKLWYDFFSNVNAAIQKDCWNEIRFRDVSYTEDQLFGMDLIKKGYIKVYAYQAAVFHSHCYSLKNYFKRYFDESRGLRNSLGVKFTFSPISFIPVISVFSDWLFILFKYKKRQFYWCCYSPMYHFVRRLGMYLGNRYTLLPNSLQKKLSLEGKGNPDAKFTL